MTEFLWWRFYIDLGLDDGELFDGEYLMKFL